MCKHAYTIQMSQDFIAWNPTMANLGSLPHLEHLVICGIFKPNTAENDTFAISGIMELISTAAPSLKKVSLCLDRYDWDRREKWRPFVPLVARRSSLSVTVYVFRRRLFFREPPLFFMGRFQITAQW